MARASKRELVLDTATALFLKNGFTATGINQITQEAGIASMTLYNNFKNKDALIMAVLERVAKERVEKLEEVLEDQPTIDQIDGLVRIYEESFEDDGFVVIFPQIAAEFKEEEHPLRQAMYKFEAGVLDLLEKHLDEKYLDPIVVLLLLNGAVSTANVLGDMTAFDTTRSRLMLCAQ